MTNAKKGVLAIERLRELAASYGADIERFPEDEREAARALLARDDQAQRVLDEASQLDLWLQAARLPSPPSVALARKVAEVPLRHPRQESQRLVFGFFLPRQAMLAGVLACTLGVLGGALTADETPSADDGWDDVTTVAFAVGLDEGGP